MSQPGDAYEQEADRLSEQVLCMPDPVFPPTTKRPDRGPQAHRASTTFPGGWEGGQPLPVSARSFFEPRFGRGLGHVRLHTDARAAGLARTASAEARPTLDPASRASSAAWFPHCSPCAKRLLWMSVHALPQRALICAS